MPEQHRRVVRQMSGEEAGQLFIETPPYLYPGAWALWMADHQAWPCPMPVGHAMFDEPAQYHCEPVTGEIAMPASLSCGCVPGFTLCAHAQRLWKKCQQSDGSQAYYEHWKEFQAHYGEMKSGAGWPAVREARLMYQIPMARVKDAEEP